LRRLGGRQAISRGQHFGIDAAVRAGNVTFPVAGGAEFVPKLFGKFSELQIPAGAFVTIAALEFRKMG
jgi:hypothetical protein